MLLHAKARMQGLQAVKRKC